jgi:hypothetical protein
MVARNLLAFTQGDAQVRVFTILIITAALISAAEPYRIVGNIPIGGASRWDYLTVDSAANRLFVSNATRVVVVDLDAGKVSGEIPDTQGVHGIALAPELNRGFISNGATNDATIFDLKTLKPIARVKTGQNPDAILFDPSTRRVFTFNGRSHDFTAFDAATGNVLATVPLGGKPEFAVADGKGTVYVNIEDTSEIVAIDARKPAVASRYSLAPCQEPSGLAIDTAHRRLFSVCGNKLMAISDPGTGKVISTVPIGDGTDGCGYDPESGFVFSSNGEGSMTLVRETGGKYEVAGTVKTERGARTMTIDPRTHKVYLPAAGSAPNSFHLIVAGR